MKVAMLCGGQGTRLREETEYRPKPLVEVGGHPILWHIMKTYAHYGHRDFILCLGYRGNMIKEYFLNYEAMNNDFTVSLGKQNQLTYVDAHEEQDFSVTLADTGLHTMTGGRLRRIKRYIGDDETFMLTYGDGVADIDISKLLEFHKSHGRVATVTATQPFSRFGMMQVGEDGPVTAFQEKPKMDGWASCGYLVLNRNIFDYLDEGDDCVFEQKPMERLAAAHQLAAYRHDGFFYAMDTFREYQQLNEIWDSGKAPWKVWQ